MLDFIEDSLKCIQCSSPFVQSDWTHISFLSYLRHLEELGLEISEDVLDGVIKAILLRRGCCRLLGGSKSK